MALTHRTHSHTEELLDVSLTCLSKNLLPSVIAQAGLPLISVSPSGLLSKYLGESEKAIKGTFEAAKRLQPCVIFLDEIDSLAPRRGKTGEEPAARRILTELLLQVNGFCVGLCN